MLKLPQTSKITWGTISKKYYEDKGYVYTNIGDELIVDARDLMPKTNINVTAICDKCDKEFILNNKKYQEQNENNSVTCFDCRYKIQGQKMIGKSKNMNKLNVYKRILNDELERFPTSFFTNITINEAKELVKCFVERILEDTNSNKDEINTLLSEENFYKYRLYGLVTKFGMFTLINETFPGKWLPWELNCVPRGYWNDDDHVKNAVRWFIKRFKDDKGIDELKKIPKTKIKKELYNYGLSGILNRFRSVSKLLLFVFPDEINEWDVCVPKGYYQKEENKIKIMKWLIKEMLKDNIIKSYDDIPKIANRDLFKKYNLESFLTNCFNLSPYNAFTFIFKDRWKRWEFKSVPPNFWNDGRNVREAIDWLLENAKKDGLIKNNLELNYLNLSKTFKLYGLAGLYVKFDIPFLLSALYPNEFDYTKYNNRLSNIDGMRLDSIEEREIHDILKVSFDSVEKIVDKYDKRFYNEKFDEAYIPDWIINDSIIVEYFGLFSDKPSYGYVSKYNKKINRKIDFYNTLSEKYIFIDLYPQDLNDNYKGFYKKFNNKGFLNK